MSVQFADYHAHSQHMSIQARNIGQQVAADIPVPSIDNNGLLATALWWAHHVGRVFPLSEATTQDKHGGKTPHIMLGRNWSADTLPTRNADTVRHWWMAAPMANVGFATQASGFLILDVDPRHEGWKHLITFTQQHGIDLSDVPRSLSPRYDGGAHLWWRLPPGMSYIHSQLVPGVDRPWQVPVPYSIRRILVDPDTRDDTMSYEFRSYLWSAGDPRYAPYAPTVLLGEGTQYHSQSSLNHHGTAVRSEHNKIDIPTLISTGVPVGQQSYVFKRMVCALIAKGYTDSAIIEIMMETANHSPVGDIHRPWRHSDFSAMINHARRFIDRRRQEETLSNQQLVWALDVGNRLGIGRYET